MLADIKPARLLALPQEIGGIRLIPIAKARGIRRKSLMKKIIHVEGMGCMKCVAHVKEALEGLDGVTSAEVSLDKNTAVITMSNDVADTAIIAAIDEAGYDVSKIEAA